ncbi:MAG: DMT family transporter [Acidobacteriota bacterium]
MPTIETTSQRSIPPALYVVAAVALWSTGGLLIKLTTFDAFTVNCGRSFFAAIIVGIFTYKKGLRLDRFTVFTSFLYAGTLSCFVYANKTTTAANAIFLQYTAPIYILILAPFILKEKFNVRDLLTVMLCLGGMALFFVDNTATQSAPSILIGNIVALISGVFFGLYILFLRHPRSLQRNPAVSVFYGNLLIVIIMAPLIAADPPASASASDILPIIVLGVFQIGVSYMLFTHGIAAGVRPMDASIIGFIEPTFNPIWVYLFVGERPSGWAVVGGTVILLTVMMHTLRQFFRRERVAEITAS